MVEHFILFLLICLPLDLKKKKLWSFSQTTENNIDIKEKKTLLVKKFGSYAFV